MGVSKHDIHKLDRFVRPFANTRIVLMVALASFIVGISMSVHHGDWQWFSRFGSLITVSGLLLVSSPVFDQGVYRSQTRAFGFAELDEEGNSAVTNEDSRKTGGKVLVGVLLSICGTFIWGFGDLLGSANSC